MKEYEYRDNLGNPRDYYDIVNDATILCKEIEEKDKEIISLNNTIIDLHSVICEKQNEVNRLNNIINELEKSLKYWLNLSKENKNMSNYTIYSNVLDILQELKEGK